MSKAAVPMPPQQKPDAVVKLLLIGDSGVGKSCLLLRFADDSFTSSFLHTIGVDFKTRKLTMDQKLVKLEVWDTAGQERFRTITQAYYRGAMGILVVYDITDMNTFNNIKDWMRNICYYAPDNVNKILIGNKSDMAEGKRQVPYAKAHALAQELGVQFFETSAKTNTNVDQAFISIAMEVMARLNGPDQQNDRKNKTGSNGTTIQPVKGGQPAKQKSGCC